jgi:integrase
MIEEVVVPYLKKDKKTGLYKYVRRVPNALVDIVGVKVWEQRLGSDLEAAKSKRTALADEHTALIKKLSDPAGYEAELRSGVLRAAAAMVEHAASPPPKASYFPKTDLTTSLLEEYKWQNAPLHIEVTSGSIEDYAERLRLVSAVSFGDTSPMEHHPLQNPHLGAIYRRLGVGSPPTGGTDRIMFDALHRAVTDKLAELPTGSSASQSDHTLSKLLSKRAKLKGLQPKTIKTYQKGIDALTARTGDLPVHQYTPKMMRQHRDYLLERGLEPTSISTMFAGIGAIMTYALREELIDSHPLAGMEYPRDTKPTEERRHLPFSKENAERIWHAAHERFGPDSKTRLEDDRRLAFLWCVKTLLLTGMRPHEFFRLRNGDVADVATFDNYHDDWKGAGIDICFSKVGNRLIPLPEKLSGLADFIQGGGLECVRQVDSIENNFSDKQFSPLLKELNLKRPRVSLYSTRSTFNMAMKNEGVSNEVRQQILGHKPEGGMMRHYTDPETMTAMAAAMNLVRFW